MSGWVYLLLLQALLTGAWTPDCGISQYPDAGFGQEWEPAGNGGQRIVNGVEARPNEFPWMVFLDFLNGTITSGASIINEKYLVGAAHTVMGGIPASAVKAHIGAHDRFGGKVFEIEEIVRHTNWSLLDMIDDITLFRVSGTIEFSDTVRGVCKPQTDNLYDGAYVTDMGWGLTENFTYPDQLRYLNMIGMTNADCSAHYVNNTVTNSMFCIDSPFERAPCAQDSGGPLVFNNNGRFELVGINSWADGCSEGVVGVTTRVSSYLDWIDDNMRP